MAKSVEGDLGFFLNQCELFASMTLSNRAIEQLFFLFNLLPTRFAGFSNNNRNGDHGLLLLIVV